MPLIALWKSNEAAVNELSVEQVVGLAGNGDLKDGSNCSHELREFLGQIPTPKIAGYVEHCLSNTFAKSGMVLQDLVNELGRRLDFNVENGRYQGTPTTVGFDGLWVSTEKHTLIVEVKTTDAYRISLDTIAGYREKLKAAGRISGNSSILIVVGREDTGELEAQIRGSRHAWDIRLLSADALLKLVQLKENAEEPETDRKIRSLLAPMEYTRLDQMIDVLFTTATDVEASVDLPSEKIQEANLKTDTISDSKNGEEKSSWEFTNSEDLQNKRDNIIEAVGRRLNCPLIKKSRALYWDATHKARVCCSISKKYTKRNSYPYWYAYHPHWDEFLQEASNGYLVLGCMDQNFAFGIPWHVIHSELPYLNTTTTEKTTYWHIHIVPKENESFAILLPKKEAYLKLDDFLIELSPQIPAI